VGTVGRERSRSDHSRPRAARAVSVGIYRIVVALLGLSILGVVGGSIALRAMGVDVPDSLVAIGTGALGAMAGLLSPLSRV
jgi:hypothetical protein